ncbi:sugar phosphate isomerase/epimerase [Paenibacillus sp. alder61]|uniref:sugar phosphate isomerase/epimerase family protein n=1 Tax=Paenibacillus sp. alder61 TaxID=2862948 RepID=UPI001CD6D08E|nr:sugar phosphate isomerase/epimerase family protein [Paenibacillus sp. alder61]MCA1295392.1 sugar phosphate isomerase/epimerase [Paenibacillus sp. alder61]
MIAREDYSVSTYAYIERPLQEAVLTLAEAGWKQIEIMCEGGHEEILVWPEARLAELKRTGEAYGIRWSLHAPITGCNPAARDEAEAARSEHLLVETLRVAEHLGCRHVVLHAGTEEEAALPQAEPTPGNEAAAVGMAEGEGAAEPAGARAGGETATESAKRRVVGFLTRVLERTAGGGAVIALENVPPYPGLLGVEVSFLWAIADEIDSPRVGLVFDCGHAHMTGSGRCLLMLQQAMSRLVALHLSDNTGQADDHLGLGGGTVPIEAMVAWLAACGYRGSWVLEMRKPEDLQPSADRLQSLTRQFSSSF